MVLNSHQGCNLNALAKLLKDIDSYKVKQTIQCSIDIQKKGKNYFDHVC